MVNMKAGTCPTAPTAIKAAMDSSQDSLEGSPPINPSLKSHAGTAGDVSFEFCGAVNMLDEGEVEEDEFDRIAEIQRRNRRCLPHMKSSYPAETQTYCKDATDEQMKTGDPMETIQQNSLVPDSRPNDAQGTSPCISNGPRRHTMAPTDFMNKPRRVLGRHDRCWRSKPTPQSVFGGVSLSRVSRMNVQHKRAADPQTLYEDEVFGVNQHGISEEASPEQICRRQSIAFAIDNTPQRRLLRKPLRTMLRGPGNTSQTRHKAPRGKSSKR
uniref:nuclear mitotic apparatus protein 1-like n=1 Tax=Myxine glutinosa TaxID=7769 RepID=UPI0035900886